MRYNLHYRNYILWGMQIMNINVDEQLGRRLWDYRAELKLTREAFSEKCGISVQFLSDIEHGRKGMSVETLYKICVAFEVSADYLIFGKPNMNFGSPANHLLDNVPNEYMAEYVTIISKLNALVKKGAK